jgi:serine/threonine protein kinase
MHHVAREGLIHKDLAARNVLLAAGDVALVADFGLSRLMNERGSVYDSGVCSIKWSAPEAVTHKRFSTASDVWSFGVLIVEVMTCRPPLENIPMSEYLLHFSAKQEEYRAQLIEDLPMSVPNGGARRRQAVSCKPTSRHDRPSTRCVSRCARCCTSPATANCS